MATLYDDPGVAYDSLDVTYNGNNVVRPAAPRCVIAPGIAERLVYVKPSGSKYLLHAPPSRTVMQTEGFGTPPLNFITDRSPFQHGDTVRDFFLAPRPVQIVMMQNFSSREEYWNGRAALLDAVRPNRITDFANPGKLLYYLANGERRQLDVIIDSGPGFAPPQPGWRAWSFVEALRFTAHDPAWYDPELQTLNFVQSVGELVFPITFPITFGSFGTTEALQYEGTWLDYPTIVVTGPVTGFSIANLTTDKQIILDYALPAGTTATFTLRGQKTVESSDGTNLLPFVTSDSDLAEFAIQPDPVAPDGENEMQVTGSGTNSNTSVSIRYYHRYIGV